MRGDRTGLRTAGLVIVGALLMGVGLGFAIGDWASGGGSGGNGNPPGLHGQATWTPGQRPAPDFRLADQNGRPISLAALRGRSVMLVFLSSRCRAACAGELRTLHTALRLVPPSARPALVVVSLDPSNDTPGSARGAIAQWGLAPGAEWHWLIGSREQLAPIWAAYGVHAGGRKRHRAPVYLIDRDGFERAGLLYPFPPGWPAGDLLILAGQA